MKIIHSYKEFYKKNGLIKTVLKIVSKPFRFIDKKIAYRNLLNPEIKYLITNQLKIDFLISIPHIIGRLMKVFQDQDLN